CDGTWHSRDFICKSRTTLSDCHGPLSAGDLRTRQIFPFLKVLFSVQISSYKGVRDCAFDSCF
ncbi:hypothetical protein R6Q57_015362, partial [Mikania cordata]